MTSHLSLEAFLELLDGVVPVAGRSDRWKARCPVHDDDRPSLDVRRGSKVPFVVYCQVCRADFKVIIAAARGARR